MATSVLALVRRWRTDEGYAAGGTLLPKYVQPRRVTAEASVLHQQVTDVELQDWITEEVRRHPNCRGFAAELRFVQLHSPYPSGATWEVDAVTGGHEWSAACRDMFNTAVRQAQRAFDLIE